MDRLAIQVTLWEDVEIFSYALRPEVTRSSGNWKYDEEMGMNEP